MRQSLPSAWRIALVDQITFVRCPGCSCREPELHTAKLESAARPQHWFGAVAKKSAAIRLADIAH